MRLKCKLNLSAAAILAAVVFLAASRADAQRYDLATFHKYSGNTSTTATPAAPAPKTPSAGGSALDTAGTVAGHSGTGQIITEAGNAALDRANSAAASELRNTPLKNRLRAQGFTGKTGTKGGHLQKIRKDLIKKAPGAKNLSRWTKAVKWLGRLAKAIDIVSPVSRMAGHICEGDWSGAGWAAADEGSKKWATTKGAALGAAGGTFVAGPPGGVVGGIAGAAAADEIYSRTGAVAYDKAAQASKDRETFDRLAGHRMRDRYVRGHRTRVRTHVPTMGGKPPPPRPTVRTGCRCGRGR